MNNENKCCNIDLRDSESAVRGDIDYDWYVLAYTNVSTGQSNCREVYIVTNTNRIIIAFIKKLENKIYKMLNLSNSPKCHQIWAEQSVKTIKGPNTELEL